MKIYIETEMTEMPKHCFKYGNSGQRCHYYLSCRAHYEAVSLLERPSWCPLRTEKEIDDNENQLLINISDKLAAYEDIGTPQELAELKAENEALRKQLENSVAPVLENNND